MMGIIILKSLELWLYPSVVCNSVVSKTTFVVGRPQFALLRLFLILFKIT